MKSKSPNKNQTHKSAPGALSLDLADAPVNVPGLNGDSQARSSVEEHHLDTVGVGGSIPPVPTGLYPARTVRGLCLE
jgi:hypothetical protein